MISRAHKTRIYPNKRQQELMTKTIGVARYAYNWTLDRCEERYKNNQPFDIYAVSRQWTAERPEWSKEVCAAPIQKSLLNAGGAYKNMFKKLAKHPKYHKKGYNDSFYINNQAGKLYGNKVKIHKIGELTLAEPLRYDDCKIMSYVISKKADKWYISIQIELEDKPKTTSTSVVGIDVGIKHWATASDGTICDSPQSLKHYQRQLKRKQRIFSRRQKGSARKEKARIAVAKVYQKITNIKLDTIHKFTTTIAKNHGLVVMEDLNLDDLKKSKYKYVRKGLQDSAISELLFQLSYKCNNYLKVEKYFPSSKTCSNCGYVNNDLTLADRSFHCPSCDITIDRDFNAALNLQRKGLEFISGGSHR